MNPLLRALLEYASRAGRGIGSFYAPRNVGVHHTLYGAGSDARFFPTWGSRYVQPSNVPTGQLAATAGDQIPGFSYFWNASGRRGAEEAANLARGQTALQFDRVMLEPATRGVGKVTTSPRFGPVADPNLPGTRARMIYGPTGQRVVGEVASPAGPLSAENANEIARLVNRQKAIEAARSASRVGATVAAATSGFWQSVADAFLGDPYSNTQRIEAQQAAGNSLGAAGTYLGTLAQGSTGMALSAGLSAPEQERQRSLSAQAARYQAQADAPVRRAVPPPPSRQVPAPSRSEKAQAARYTAQGNSLVPRLTPPSAPRPAPRVVQPRRTGGGGTNRFL